MNNILEYAKRPTPITIILLIIAFIFMRLLGVSTIDTLILSMYFITIAASLNIIMGFAGYVSFGQCVFLGVGGYIYALTIYYVSFFNALQKVGGGLGIIAVGLIASCIAALIAAGTGAAVLRLRGAFFAIATIGLDLAIMYIILGLVPFINPTQFYGAQIILPSRCLVDNSIIFNAMLISMGVAVIINYIIRRSKFGIGLIAIKEDEDAAEAMGVPTTKYKLVAFTVSAFLTSLAGAVFYLDGGGVSVLAFDLSHTIDMIVMIVIGGLGTVLGPLIGGLIYFWLYDTLLKQYPGINLIILGIIVAAVILFAPEGIVGLLRKYKVGKVRLRDILE